MISLIRGVALLACLIGVGAAPIPDPAPPVLLADSEMRWVDFTLTRANQIRFAATIDGIAVTALLDTGASRSLLTDRFVKRSDRKTRPSGSVAAIGGWVALRRTEVSQLAFGGVMRSGGTLDTGALPAGVTGGDDAIDLLVGRDLTDRFALDIDFATRRFRLLPSGRLPFVGRRAPLTIGPAPHAYLTSATIAGRRVRPIVVDTGDGGALSLSGASWRTLPLSPLPQQIGAVHGVGGPAAAMVATLPDIAIGTARFAAVPTWIERTGGFSDTIGSAGRIGMGLLMRQRVLLDPAAGQIVFGPPSATSLPTH